MTAVPPAHTAADDHVRLVAPLLGLGGTLDFTLRALDEHGTVFALRSEDACDDAPGTRLYLVHAAAHVAGYAPDTTAMHLALLGEDGVASSPDDIATLVVLNPEGADGVPTVNLLAPLLVDTRTHRAVQVVLEGDWPVQTPLSPTSVRKTS
ncbi:flagellar assembly protein FliW [Sanguibacter sp. HDW7]|uniref:flagellar assembly protein FliW n=1 Tax=Sanguibacter sp. HDW7 TaxID=2714931 RepID=UPI00140C065B|nr:flagellar assembly protein FliW [Sanguibacter sp. HDW7]QIK84320.1 flagellar assembly protein FliW [Sanguibacter sp. HDW7]